MTTQAQRTDYDRVREAAVGVLQRPWEHLWGERIVADGSVAAALPANATIIRIGALGGDVFYEINGSVASAASPGVVPEDTVQDVGPIYNLTAFCVFGGGATVYAHLQYFREL